MIFTLATDYGPPFRGIVTSFHDVDHDVYPYDIVCDFDGGGVAVPDWTIPWMGADDPIFFVVCPD